MPSSFVTRAGPSLNLSSETVIVKEMRILLLSLTTALAFPAMAADPPSKRGGGFFGFGAPPAEQISAGLFPEAGSGQTASTGLSSTATRQRSAAPSSDGIFRSGEPQQVAPVSYVIENGRRVERPVAAAPAAPLASTTAPVAPPLEKPALAVQTLSSPTPAPVLAATNQGAEKKRGFLGFGKKDSGDADSNPVVTPVPAAAPLIAATPVAAPAPAPAAVKPGPVAKPTPVAKPEAPATVDTPASNQVKVDTPTFAGVKPEKEKSSWIPFLGRKKNEESTAAPVASPPVVATPTAPAMTASPVPATASPAPAAEKPAANEVATFEIRRDDSKPSEPKKEEKADREGGLLAPISKIRPPRKEIDLTGAETIISNGEIVKEAAPAAATVAATPGTSPVGPRQAPQVVNGVKTYTSWDDVNARSTSAADRIIGGIR
jgi:hypothetical protein